VLKPFFIWNDASTIIEAYCIWLLGMQVLGKTKAFSSSPEFLFIFGNIEACSLVL
jgi:hypothetical protein